MCCGGVTERPRAVLICEQRGMRNGGVTRLESSVGKAVALGKRVPLSLACVCVEWAL